jgi:hypothetical protein
MKMKSIGFMALLAAAAVGCSEKTEVKSACGCGTAAGGHEEKTESRPVAGEGEIAAARLDLPERHFLRKTLGRDYWTYFYSWKFSDPMVKLEGIWDSPEVANLPMFKDCGIVYWSGKLHLPEGKGVWRTVEENFYPSVLEKLENAGKLGRPITLMFHPKCRYLPALVGEVDLDYDNYKAFKEKHPNITAVRVQSEWGVELVQIMLGRNDKRHSPELRAKFNEIYDRYSWTNRYDRLQQAYWYMNRHKEIHYNDNELFESFRSANFLDHMAAAAGATTLVSETTGTGDRVQEYRWDVSSMFIRGAARQFDVDWRWYVAGYFNGFKQNGEWMYNSHCGYPVEVDKSKPSKRRPECGVSDSVERRVCYFAYLNGAGGIEMEAWGGNFFVYDEKTGKVGLSPRGRNFSDFHDFTAAHPDRGAPYAPVAVLVPIAQGYNTCGGKAWGFCPYTPADHMIDGIFFTLCPGWDKRTLYSKGREGLLHNSKFAMMHDVLVPDTPQKREDFLKALDCYPAAILAGDHPASEELVSRMKRYVSEGGTLVLNSAYLERGFGGDFTGVDATGGRFECSGSFTDDFGKTHEVKGEYDCLELKPASSAAKVLLRDGKGRILATRFRYGKGIVVTVSPLWMAPRFTSGDAAVVKTRLGQISFPFAEYVLGRLQRDLFPFKVEGDCQYGANRRKDGWWLWVMNNNGITKYADRHQIVDPAAASDISVDLGKVKASKVRELIGGSEIAVAGGKFDFTVKPGEVAIFEIIE